MRKSLAILGMLAGLSLPGICSADEESAGDFMRLHQDDRSRKGTRP